MKSIIASIFLLSMAIQLFAQQEESVVYKKYSTQRGFEVLSTFENDDEAVGLQVKGKLANVLTNFGELSSFHVASPSLEWPAFGEGQDDQQQYGWGVDLLVGYKGDVIESFQDPASNLIDRDWHPANENLFSGNVTVSEDDLTPIMATSDNILTWPIGDNGPFWPGLFRMDTSGTVFEGQFTSERDLYSVYTDAGNQTPYGIRVEQTAYSFARRYAEDFLVYRFNIQNTSDQTLEDLYPGMINQFLIDFDNHDLIDFIDSNNDGQKDLVYLWDEDNAPREPWSKVGYIGLVVLKSPRDLGITDFHYFHDDFIPSNDDMFWRLMTSDTTGLPDTTKQIYFHGDDIHIDDVSFAAGLDPEGNNKGGEISWSFSSGPVTLAPDESVPLEIAIVCGDTKEDLLDNVQWVWFLAGNAWNGSNPPSPPNVSAFAGDGQVTITWDAATSENSIDNITGEHDFEGYKLYRSTDRGKSWGKETTDSRGNFNGFKPLEQFDLKNGIKGEDPISNRDLGTDNGLKHTFVDTNVINGIEYWYTVTAYDGGDNINQVESLESALGLTTNESNLVSAFPFSTPSNLSDGQINLDGNKLVPDSGFSDGSVSLEIIDQSLLKDREYKITFNDDVPVILGTDTVDIITTFNLLDKNSGDSILVDHPLSDESGDNIPVIDGFRLKLEDSSPDIKAEWTVVNGDTSTFIWTTKPWGANDIEVVYTDFSFKLVVDTTVGGGLTAPWYDLWAEEFPTEESLADALPDSIIDLVTQTEIHLPLKAYMISLDTPVDVSENVVLGEFLTSFFGLLSPIGWDFEPGGAAYSAFQFPDRIIMEFITADADTHGLRLVTQHEPGSTPPSHGDEFTIRVPAQFREGLVYSFSTESGNYKSVAKSDLKKVKVVPNPFFVTSAFKDQLMFTNLPGQCDINIYNVAGDLIKKIEHVSGSGAEYWDLKNENGLDIAYGLYIYVLKTENGAKHKGKFSVIR